MFFKVTTKDTWSTYSIFPFFVSFEVAKDLSNSEEDAQMIRPKRNARRSLNGTEPYFFNTNEQRTEVSVAKLLWIFFLNGNLATMYIDVYIKDTDDIYDRYL